MKSFYSNTSLGSRTLLRSLIDSRKSTFNVHLNSWSSTNRPIVILSILLMLFSALSALAQTQVTGVVKDADGEAVVGATASIKGSSAHAVVDVNGKFSIGAPKELPFTIRISSVGYKLQEVEIYELSEEPLEITLVDDGLLEEVVVTSRRREETAQNVPIP